MRSDLFVCGLKLMQHRTLRRRRAEMQRAQLLHELVPQRRPALLQQLGADRQLLASPAGGGGPRRPSGRAAARAGSPFRSGCRSPSACGWDRRALRSRPASTSRFSRSARMLEAMPSSDRVQQLAEMAAVAEHDVADDDQAPAVAEHLQRQVDRASRAVRNVHCPPIC